MILDWPTLMLSSASGSLMNWIKLFTSLATSSLGLLGVGPGGRSGTKPVTSRGSRITRGRGGFEETPLPTAGNSRGITRGIASRGGAGRGGAGSGRSVRHDWVVVRSQTLLMTLFAQSCFPWRLPVGRLRRHGSE